MNNDIYLHHHLGLGDHICMNGMVWEIQRQNPESQIYLFCKSKYYSNISILYRDTPIVLIPIPSWTNEVSFTNLYAGEGNLIRFGFDKYIPREDATCDQIFYEQMSMDYNLRFDGFKINRDNEQESKILQELTGGKDYIFVHDDPSRGFVIDVDTDTLVIRNDTRHSIFHMMKLMENAKEIHCIESCFRCLTEHINTDDIRLVYHNTVRPCKITSRKQWEYV